MDVSLGSGYARHLELLPPLPHPDPAACPLGALGALAPLCSSLRSLRLHHVAVEVLPVVGHLYGLQELEARVYFGPAADPGWLDWASELRALRCLALRAAVLRLQPEEGLGALAPLAPTLTSLTLRGCVLLGDAGCAALAALCNLRNVAVTPCSFGQEGLDLLTAALSNLDRAELRLQDGVAPHKLLHRGRSRRQAQAGDAPAEAEGREPAPPPASVSDGSTSGIGEHRRPWGMLGGLTAHVSRTKALGLLTTACAIAPGLRDLEIRHSGGPFLLASPLPLGALAPGLRSLALPGIQLLPEAVAQLVLCTGLER